MLLSSRRALDRIMGHTASGNATTMAAAAQAGPRLEKLHDPVDDIEVLVETLDEADPKGRIRNRHLRKGRGDGVGRNNDGEYVLGGRRCCFLLSTSLDRRLQSVKMGQEFLCTCGTTWAVVNRLHQEIR